MKALLSRLTVTLVMAAAVLIFYGCADVLAKTIDELYIVNDPVFSPVPGNYGSDIDIILSTSTPGATIWYSEDGSEPSPGTAGSTRYSGPIPVSPANSPFRLFVKAFKSGMTPSSEVIGPFNVHYSGPSAPTLRVVPDSGVTFNPTTETWSGRVDVYVDGDPSNEDGTNQWMMDSRPPSVHYTLDGTIPGSGSPSVDNGTNLLATIAGDGADVTVNALTVVGGDYPDSQAANRRVRVYFTDRVADPVFTDTSDDPVREVCYTAAEVKVSSSTPGASVIVEYELNGDGNWNSLGSVSSPRIVTVFPAGWSPVNGDVANLRARATGSPGQGDSEWVFVSFVFLEGSIEKPVITPATGIYSGTTQLVISSDFPGATIYYTDDGTIPTPTVPNRYTSPVNLAPSTYYINAIAEFNGLISAVSSAVIGVNP